MKGFFIATRARRHKESDRKTYNIDDWIANSFKLSLIFFTNKVAPEGLLTDTIFMNKHD